MLRSILAVLAASVIAFIYGWISWGMLPWHHPLPFENENEVVAAIKANTSEHAMYAYPSWQDMGGEDKGQAYMDEWTAGPAIYAMVRPGEKDPSAMSASMAGGFVINILAATALLLLMQKSGHTEFFDRVSIALLAGLFLAIISALNPWNWLEAPGINTLATLADGIIPWTLAGIAMALILPKNNPA